MKFNPEGYKQTRWRFFALLAVFWLIAIELISDSYKDRSDYKVVNGIVTEKGNTIIKFKADTYVYYFRLSNNKQHFGIVTDENYNPSFDKSFKGLSLGDAINVTFEENWATNLGDINLRVHEIVRNGNVVYDNMPISYWTGRMKLGIICFILGLMVLTGIIIMNKKYNQVTIQINRE